LLQQPDQRAEAVVAYRAALVAAKLKPERPWLKQRIAELDGCE
jgi:predicted RNA polymerase sigma factor